MVMMRRVSFNEMPKGKYAICNQVSDMKINEYMANSITVSNRVLIDTQKFRERMRHEQASHEHNRRDEVSQDFLAQQSGAAPGRTREHLTKSSNQLMHRNPPEDVSRVRESTGDRGNTHD
jgi:hypothetical protein